MKTEERSDVSETAIPAASKWTRWTATVRRFLTGAAPGRPAAKPRRRWQIRLAHIIHHPAASWVVLALSLTITALSWYLADHFVKGRAHERFLYQTAEAQSAIAHRMTEYELALRGGAGLFAASKSVERSEWRRYVSSLDIHQTYPGILGMGFSLVVAPVDLAQHEAEVRAQGYPDYRVWPRGERPQYAAVVYLEPVDSPNRSAFGFDMYSDRVRREAMDRARDSGAAAVTGIVRLVEETAVDSQRDFLMYVPVYRNGWPTGTPEQRRAALEGYVYSPFRTDDLMRGVLPANITHIDFSLFDGDKPAAGHLLYESNPETAETDWEPPALFSRNLPMEVGGRTWMLRMRTLPGYLPASEAYLPWVWTLASLVVSMLLFSYVRAVSEQERRALSIAFRMTSDLEQEMKRRQAAEAARRASEEQLYTAFRNAPLGITELAPSDGRIIMINPAFCALVGYSESELLGRPISEITHPEDRAADAEGLRKLVDGAITTYHREKRYIHRDGSQSWAEVRVALIRDEQGRPMNTVGVVADITDRKLLEAQLSERTRQLLGERDFIDTVLETQAALVLVVDSAGRVVRFNQACELATGLDSDEMRGREALLELVSPEEREAAQAHVIDKLQAGADLVEFENQFNRRDGTRRLILWRCKALRDEDGALRYIVATGTDITEQRQAEESAREHLEEMSRLQRMQTANELATMLAHELNQPLAAIATYAAASRQLMKRTPPDPEKFITNLDHISQQAILAGDIIHHLRQFIGRGRIAPAPVDLNAVVDDACAMMMTMAKRRRITIEIDPDRELPPVMGVAVHVEQVVLNLLRNAFEAILGAAKEGGTITVQTRRAGDMAEVTVHDSGPGIAPELISRLFDPMTSEKPNGLGVGLSISRRLIEALDGKLWLEDRRPGGHFHFVLPLAR
jgi:PAS domain S-box-containing protein